MIWLFTLVVLVAIALVYYFKSSDSFTDSGLVFYSEQNREGNATRVKFGDTVLLHDGKWRVWSCACPGAAIKVTADGLPHALYMRGGRIDNLPAALGGLPAHENYTAIINSGRNIRAAIVPLAQARDEVASSRSHCIATHIYGTETCETEFAGL